GEASRSSRGSDATASLGAGDVIGISVQLLIGEPRTKVRGFTSADFRPRLARSTGGWDMRRQSFCGSAAHALDRRAFLGAAGATAAAFAADMTGLNVLGQPALAKELKKQQKRCILLWLAGGASQLETWDPKPGAQTGGPFRSIPT